MPRDSTTHPLRIDGLPVGSGFVGLTMCPGQWSGQSSGQSSGQWSGQWSDATDASESGGGWARDLETDLDAVRDWGAQAVVSLIEDPEFRLLQVAGLGNSATARGIDWHHFPIPDMATPEPATMARWRDLSRHLSRLLAQGGRVLIHCRAGLGRSGTVAALILIDHGHPPRDAIRRVRAARTGAIETQAQEQFVMAYAQDRGAG